MSFRTMKHNCPASVTIELQTQENPFKIVWKVTFVNLEHKKHENSQVNIILFRCSAALILLCI